LSPLQEDSLEKGGGPGDRLQHLKNPHGGEHSCRLGLVVLGKTPNSLEIQKVYSEKEGSRARDERKRGGSLTGSHPIETGPSTYSWHIRERPKEGRPLVVDQVSWEIKRIRRKNQRGEGGKRKYDGLTQQGLKKGVSRNW